MQGNPLGKQIDPIEQYDSSLLFKIRRQDNRHKLGLSEESLPFFGEDVWNAYEISWLDFSGRPVIATGVFTFPVNSAFLVESKSFKLYLNSFNNTQFESRGAVINILKNDLSKITGSTVGVELHKVTDPEILPATHLEGFCLDQLKITTDKYTVAPSFLKVDKNEIVEEIVSSNLFRSCCPVTSQPDWGSVVISYKGNKIDHEGLLKYIISYRKQQCYHEDCAERIFVDISNYCQPQRLTVAMYFLRRGGLDINPVRSSEQIDARVFKKRLVRQ